MIVVSDVLHLGIISRLSMLLKMVLFHPFLITEWYSIVYRYHNFFIHSLIDGHLGGFPVLALVKSASVNVGLHVLFQIRVFSGYMPRSGIAGSIIILLSTVFFLSCNESKLKSFPVTSKLFRVLFPKNIITLLLSNTYTTYAYIYLYVCSVYVYICMCNTYPHLCVLVYACGYNDHSDSSPAPQGTLWLCFSPCP